jgi:hypothetical protein
MSEQRAVAEIHLGKRPMKSSRESKKEPDVDYAGESKGSRSLHIFVMPRLLNALPKVHHH